MRSNKTLLQRMPGKLALTAVICALGSTSALADYEPNDNYSSLVLSYQSANFADPVCIGADCHEGVYGPAGVFARQIMPNVAVGVAGSYLQSSGSSSSIKSTNGTVFVRGIAGLGSNVDVGVSVSALTTTLELCATNPSSCSSTSDTGTGLGVFGKVFLNDKKSLSAGLSYDTISYQKAPDQSIVALSIVSILARRHRLALTFDKTFDANGTAISSGHSLGYSYIVF